MLFRITKVPGHYINRKMQYSTARTAVRRNTYRLMIL